MVRLLKILVLLFFIISPISLIGSVALSGGVVSKEIENNLKISLIILSVFYIT
jgi:hypothetical protein